MEIAIVGGGAAGLAAGYELGLNGHSVSVFERSPFVGGQASTFDIFGVPLERGYHHLFTSDTDMIQLLTEIGLDDKLKWISSSVGTLHDNKIYNFVSAIDLLLFKPLPFIDRIRLGLITLYLQRITNWEQFEKITAHEWLLKCSGTRIYETFWEPMLRGKFGEQYYKTISMTWIWGKIHTRFASRGKGLGGEKLGYPIDSFGEIFDRLAEKIVQFGGNVHTSTSVSEIMVSESHVTGISTIPSPASWTSPQPLEYHPSEGTGIESPQTSISNFDQVIVTAPSYVIPKICNGLSDSYVKELQSIEYLSAVVIILVLKNPLSSVYWLNVTDRTIPFVGIIEQTNFLSPDHYNGNHIAYVTNYMEKNHPLYNLSHRELLNEYLPHLQKINKEFDSSWIIESYYHKVDAAQPLVGTNYSSKISDHRSPVKGMYLANTTQIYPEDRGTNYSIRIGRNVARMLMDDHS